MNSAMNNLKAMDAQIADAQSHLRVLEQMNSPQAVTLRSKLAGAVKQRDDMMAALQTEMNRPKGS
jgi:hypothetical protein